MIYHQNRLSDVETTLRYTFLYRVAMFAPWRSQKYLHNFVVVVIPEIFAQTQEYDYQQFIH